LCGKNGFAAQRQKRSQILEIGCGALIQINDVNRISFSIYLWAIRAARLWRRGLMI
jgi:hypothetical protein